MKYEWRKKDSDIYLPKKIQIIDLPKMKYLTIDGAGVPGDDAFAGCVGALYAISYALKMNLKNREGFYDYTVFPLEGFWDLDEVGRKKYSDGEDVINLKGHMVYTMMIRQPEFVTTELFEEFKQMAYDKKKDPNILNVCLKEIEEGLNAQMIHIGSYNDEPASFKTMEEYVLAQGYRRVSKLHKEIYISDPSRVPVEKLKTTIRFKVERV